MNLFSYVDKYGGKPFSEEPFNEVDNAIFDAYELSKEERDFILNDRRVNRE